MSRRSDGRYQASVTRKGRRIYRVAATPERAIERLDEFLSLSVKRKTDGLRHHTRRARAIAIIATVLEESRRQGWADEYLARVLVAQLAPSRIKRDVSGPCAYCGTWIASTIDHIIPRSLGGTDDPANLTSACWSCNSRKGDRPAAVMANSDGSRIAEVA